VQQEIKEQRRLGMTWSNRSAMSRDDLRCNTAAQGAAEAWYDAVQEKLDEQRWLAVQQQLKEQQEIG